MPPQNMAASSSGRARDFLTLFLMRSLSSGIKPRRTTVFPAFLNSVSARSPDTSLTFFACLDWLYRDVLQVKIAYFSLVGASVLCFLDVSLIFVNVFFQRVF